MTEENLILSLTRIPFDSLSPVNSFLFLVGAACDKGVGGGVVVCAKTRSSGNQPLADVTTIVH